MTGKELYEKIGGNYDKVMATLHTDEMVLKFAKMFLDDTSFPDLKKAMEAEDYTAAFKAAHALKGVCLNMCYERLGNKAMDITEGLRDGKDINSAKEKLPDLEKDYEEMIAEIKNL